VVNFEILKIWRFFSFKKKNRKTLFESTLDLIVKIPQFCHKKNMKFTFGGGGGGGGWKTNKKQ
jgi:hypothetical protein